MAVEGDRSERKVELEPKLPGWGLGRLGEELDKAGRFERGRRDCGTGAVIAEGGQGKAAAAAELGLAQVAAVEGVEDLAPLSGSAGAGHPEPSRRSRRAVDGLGQTLTTRRTDTPARYISISASSTLLSRRL